jgi:hypothetical protein
MKAHAIIDNVGQDQSEQSWKAHQRDSMESVAVTVFSMAESRVGDVDILANCIVTADSDEPDDWSADHILSAFGAAPSASAWSAFRTALRQARNSPFDADSAIARLCAIVANALPNAVFDSLREPELMVGRSGRVLVGGTGR